jgi:hypothetical protein
LTIDLSDLAPIIPPIHAGFFMKLYTGLALAHAALTQAGHTALQPDVNP